MTAFDTQRGNPEIVPNHLGLLPLVLKVPGRRTLVVGAGSVAHRKVETLVASGAQVRVVAPELGTDLETWWKLDAAWEWQERVFRDDDVSEMFLVVAATDSRTTNARVVAAAGREGALVNVVDDPSACDFYLPAVLRRGSLQIAVSTGGRAPGLAGEMRRRLERLFDERWGEAVELVGRARAQVLERDLPEESQRLLLGSLAGIDIGALLEQGGIPRVEQAVRECMSQY